MRLPLLLALFGAIFAGCVEPAPAVDPIFGICPQWLDGESTTGAISTGESAEFHPNATVAQYGKERFLDRYHVELMDVQTDGVIELRAWATDDNRTLRFTDSRDPATTRTPTFIALNRASEPSDEAKEDGAKLEFDIQLTNLTNGADPGPTGIRFTLNGQGNVTGSLALKVTPGYRVCGMPEPN